MLDVPLLELFVAFDCIFFLASSASAASAAAAAASQKGLKIWKPPPVHEHGSSALRQKNGDGSVENAQNCTRTGGSAARGACKRCLCQSQVSQLSLPDAKEDNPKDPSLNQGQQHGSFRTYR